jgi:DNA-binding NtrC family response regulator
MRQTTTIDDARWPKVLLVDPHEQTRVLLGQLLADDGCVVIAVPNYAQALVGARREAPTVIVTELYGGTILSPQQYVAALRRHSPAPIIVLSTVVPSPPEVVEWGLWAALVKGDRPQRLLEMVRRAHASV